MSGVPLTYKTKVICRNCANVDELDIPYKTEVIDYITKRECKFCGVTKTLLQLRPEGLP